MHDEEPEEVSTHQAKTHLSRYLSLVEEGAEIIIKRGRVAVAKLVGLDSQEDTTPRRPKVGVITSEKVQYTKDCFLPLDDSELSEWGL